MEAIWRFITQHFVQSYFVKHSACITWSCTNCQLIRGILVWITNRQEEGGHIDLNWKWKTNKIRKTIHQTVVRLEKKWNDSFSPCTDTSTGNFIFNLRILPKSFFFHAREFEWMLVCTHIPHAPIYTQFLNSQC